jgi:DNA-binding response OmpR family regulator
MPSKPQTRLLYVDYDDDSREMLKLLLGISQIDVTAVASAESALSLIDAERFDMFLLDSWLADTDGFELCRMMRKSHPNTPVLFFSGAAYESDKRRGMEAGASAYLCKPDLDGLLGSITRFVPQSDRVAA